MDLKKMLFLRKQKLDDQNLYRSHMGQYEGSHEVKGQSAPLRSERDGPGCGTPMPSLTAAAPETLVISLKVQSKEKSERAAGRAPTLYVADLESVLSTHWRPLSTVRCDMTQDPLKDVACSPQTSHSLIPDF